MLIGVPKEIKTNENRVALVPAGAEALVAAGHQVLVEKGAGDGSGFEDEQYVAAGAKIGADAGASLSHSHSHLIALPVVPKRVWEEMSGCREYFHFRDRCLFCDLIAQEMEQKVRVVEESGEFIACAPYAPRFPFETWIIPKRHQCAYEMIERDQAKALSAIFRRTLRRLNLALENPPFNYIIHSAAFQEWAGDSYHWHIEIMPKLTKVAGFEWGSGFYINPTPPEESAKYLRELSE